MDTLSSELSLIASLLDVPDVDTKEAVLELAVHYPWLQPAADELAKLPVDVWQAEHNRLFSNNGYANVPIGYVQLRLLCKRMGMGLINASADYLGVLLECAAHLHANPALGKIFWPELWHEHIACWIPGLCSELKHKSRLALYRIIAERLCELFPHVQFLVATV